MKEMPGVLKNERQYRGAGSHDQQEFAEAELKWGS
jgi:hypothetical protein